MLNYVLVGNALVFTLVFSLRSQGILEIASKCGKYEKACLLQVFCEHDSILDSECSPDTSAATVVNSKSRSEV